MGDPRDERRPLWALALGLAMLVAIFPQFALGALGPQLRAELGLAPSDLGLVFAGLFAIGVVGSPIAGPLADRLGGRRSSLGLLVGTGAALLLASFATSRTGLILAMLPAGAAMAFANPGVNRWAAAATSRRQQTLLIGVAQAGVQVGALLAGLLAAASATGLDWRAALRVGAGLAVVGLVVAWSAPADHGVATAAGWRAPRPVSTHAQRRDQRALAGYALLMGGGSAVAFAYLPTFAVEAAGFSVASAGATTLVFGTTALACRLSLGVVLRTTEDLRPMLLAMAVGGIAAIGLIGAGARVPALVWAGAVLFGATGTTWPAVAFLAVVRAAPPGTAGRVTGWVTAAFYLGLWAMPPLAGQLIERIGYGAAWLAAATAYLGAIVPAAFLARPGGRTPASSRR